MMQSVWFWSLTTLIVGMIIGFIAQRAGFCSIGGWRDYVLFKDTSLWWGVPAFIVGGIIGYTILSVTGSIFYDNQFPWGWFNGWTSIPGSVAASGVKLFPADAILNAAVWAIIGAVGIGFFSTLAGGCPLRQTVMAGEGSKSSYIYLIGFIVGAPLAHYLFLHLL